MDFLQGNNTDMKSEEKRLQTYQSWTYWGTQMPGDLANCGMFYTNDQDRVECAFCHGVLKKWQKSDIPWEEHRRHFPTCPFIEGIDVGNIPLLPMLYNNDSYNSAYAASRHFYTNPVLPGRFQNGNVRYDFNMYVGPSQYVQCNSKPEPEQHNRPSYQASVPCINQPEPHDNGRSYQSSAVCVKQLESRSELSNQAHGRCINQPPVAEHFSTIHESNLPSEQINSSDILEKDFKIQSCRLQTFKSWPSQLAQTPEMLSAAGFYHIPSEEKPDRVKCAYCDGKLFAWKVDDDPFIVHASAFSYCPYMEECIGKDVLDNLQSQQLPREFNTHPRNIEDTNLNQSPSTEPERTSSSSTLQTEDSLTKHMRSEPVRAVLEMGFCRDLVRQTVETCLIERRAHLPSGEELASMVMELEQPNTGEAVAKASTPMTPLQKMMFSRHTNSLTSGIAEGAGTSQMTKHLGNTGVVCHVSEAREHLKELPPNNGIGATSSEYQETHEQKHQKKHDATNYRSFHATGNTIRSENDRLKDQILCKICMEVKVSVTFIPCGHLACCDTCSRMSECPICRSVVIDRVKTYI